MKTLKDIKHKNQGFMQDIDDINTFKKNLKAEAVKWIKKDMEDWNSISKAVLLDRWIKRFDLKREGLK